MSELEREHRGQVNFEVVVVKSPEVEEQVRSFGLGSHGLVALTPDGQVRGKIPGHDFAADARAQIQAQVALLLE